MPTIYQPIFGWPIHSNQYSVTKHAVEIDVASGTFAHPGLFFEYDFSPIMVKFTETRRSFLQFLTSLCAIVGGMLTVAGMVDSLIHQTEKTFKKKD